MAALFIIGYIIIALSCCSSDDADLQVFGGLMVILGLIALLARWVIS